MVEPRIESKESIAKELIASIQTNEQLSIYLMNLAAHNFSEGSLDYHLMSEAAERLKNCV